jgi:hypothetical protein
MFCDVWNGAFGYKAIIHLNAVYLCEKNLRDIWSQNDENVQAKARAHMHEHTHTHLSLVVPTKIYLQWHR